MRYGNQIMGCGYVSDVSKLVYVNIFNNTIKSGDEHSSILINFVIHRSNIIPLILDEVLLYLWDGVFLNFETK